MHDAFQSGQSLQYEFRRPFIHRIVVDRLFPAQGITENSKNQNFSVKSLLLPGLGMREWPLIDPTNKWGKDF